MASSADHERDARNREIRSDAARVARELIERHGLPMKVVGVDFLDRSADFDKVVAVYFTAPHRVDFRQLLGDLARTLESRIDLRQVGARDAARLIGGVGSCGREFCCTTFLTDFEPVSLRLAKVQGIPANPLQIAGACGKLMCCLKFEHPLYERFHAEAPPSGRRSLSTGAGARHRPPGSSGLGPGAHRIGRGVELPARVGMFEAQGTHRRGVA
ncbi:PSP1 domain-containing protein [Tessaracoccus coleopterorum]|uniref:PSP1 domain-containing protein n=1 Tax=Tessaracoccus coleopterorum TaxID=2714950 RepID=UPI001E2D8B79|nr:regulatory iron-sulfur-containing complex subunit RicT [Tessaracoccus coleopterorum]